jgi:hypothetical protein
LQTVLAVLEVTFPLARVVWRTQRCRQGILKCSARWPGELKEGLKMKTQQSEIVRLSKKIINDWHADDRNFTKEEPDGLKLARLIQAQRIGDSLAQEHDLL